MRFLCGLIKKNRSIRVLNLAKNDICNEKMLFLTEALKDNKNIEKIDLSWSKIDFKLLSDLIKFSQNLKNLNLSNTFLNQGKKK